MKTVELTHVAAPVEALLHLATDAGILLRLPDGQLFYLAAVPASADDDFADEIARTRQNRALMDLLDARSQDQTRIPADEARRRLGLE